MHVYATPRRGSCASCDGRITGATVFRLDEAYCCVGCADGGPCVCLYEQDRADDGVDGLGMPFAEPPTTVGRADGPGRADAPDRAPAQRP